MKNLEKFQAKREIANEDTEPAEKRIRARKFLKKDSKSDDTYVGAETEAQSEGRLKALMKKLES